MGAVDTSDGSKEGPCLEGPTEGYKAKSVVGVGPMEGLAIVGTAVVGASAVPALNVGLAVSA